MHQGAVLRGGGLGHAAVPWAPLELAARRERDAVSRQGEVQHLEAPPVRRGRLEQGGRFDDAAGELLGHHDARGAGGDGQEEVRVDRVRGAGLQLVREPRVGGDGAGLGEAGHGEVGGEPEAGVVGLSLYAAATAQARPFSSTMARPLASSPSMGHVFVLAREALSQIARRFP